MSYKSTFDLEKKRIGNIGNTFVAIYECDGMKEIARIPNLRYPFHLCFSPDGTQVAIKNTSGKIKVFDIASQECISNQVSRKIGEGSSMFYVDADRILSCDWWGKLYLYNIKLGETTICHTFTDIKTPNLIPTEDGFLAYADYYIQRKGYCDCFTEFYQVSVEDTVKVKFLLKEECELINNAYACFKDKVFFYSVPKNQIYCYDIKNVSMQPLYKLPDHEIRLERELFNDISISPDGKKIALAFNTHVRVYNTKNYELILLHQLEHGYNVSFLNKESLWIGTLEKVEVIQVLNQNAGMNLTKDNQSER